MNDPSQPGINPNPPRPVLTPNQPRQVIQPRQGMVARPAGAPAQAPAVHVPQPRAETPIALVEEAEEIEETHAPSKIVFGPDITHRKHEWKRTASASGTGACRVRTFHGKLSEQGIEYLDDSINTWLDAHPEVEVKFVTSTVGMFDGKMKDLALILSVWY